MHAVSIPMSLTLTVILLQTISGRLEKVTDKPSEKQRRSVIVLAVVPSINIAMKALGAP